jgi:hypothetical protein
MTTPTPATPAADDRKVRLLEMAVPDRPADGEFRDFEDWVNTATRKIGGMNPLCADAQDRVCTMGLHFMRARDEGSFPVRFWFNAGGQSARQQDRDADRADALLHPYRSARLRRSIKREFWS